MGRKVKSGPEYRGLSDVEKMERIASKRHALEIEREAEELFMTKFKPIYPELEFENVIVIRDKALRYKDGKIYTIPAHIPLKEDWEREVQAEGRSREDNPNSLESFNRDKYR